MRYLVRMLVVFTCVAVLLSSTAAQSLTASETPAVHAAPQQSRLVVFESFMRLG
jgi:hypothetical protein